MAHVAENIRRDEMATTPAYLCAVDKNFTDLRQMSHQCKWDGNFCQNFGEQNVIAEETVEL